MDISIFSSFTPRSRCEGIVARVQVLLSSIHPKPQNIKYEDSFHMDSNDHIKLQHCIKAY